MALEGASTYSQLRPKTLVPADPVFRSSRMTVAEIVAAVPARGAGQPPLELGNALVLAIALQVRRRP